MKVSIIVPVYNVEAYLRRCLDSLINQTYEDIGIIVVNDGSPDHSQEIIDEYVKNYPEKVSSLIKENGGLSDARNFGLRTVDDGYVMFVDSDDYVEKDYVKRAVEVLEKDGSDMAVFGYVQDYMETGTEEVIPLRIEGVHRLKDDPYILVDTPNAAWNKIYRVSLFKDNGIEFPKGLIYEDLATTPRLLTLADKVSYFNEPLYRYQVGRPGQIMGKVRDDVIRVGELLVAYFKEKGLFETYYEELYAILWRNVVSILRAAMKSDDKKKVHDLIDKAFDFKQKAFPKDGKKYPVTEGKTDAVYLNRTLCKTYYKLKHL